MEDLRCPGRELDPAFDEGDRAFEFERIVEGVGGAAIGVGGLRVLGTVEMLGQENDLPVPVPIGGRGVQIAPLLAQKRPIDAVADQGVGEGIAVLAGPNELAAKQFRAIVFRRIQYVAKLLGGKFLADHRRRLDRLFVLGAEAVDLGKDQALDGGGEFGVLAAQQLFQVKGTSGRAFETAAHEFGIEVRQIAGQRARLLGAKRPEIDGRQGGIPRRLPPAGIDRIAVDSRGH